MFLTTKNSMININNAKINIQINVDKKVLPEKLDKLEILTFRTNSKRRIWHLR